jgi:hypothetical protein
LCGAPLVVPSQSGYRDLAKLATAIEHEIAQTAATSSTEEAAIVATA